MENSFALFLTYRTLICMPVSTTYATVLVMVLSEILPKLGITLGNDELTTTVQVLATIGGGLYLLVKRYQAGGINILGLRL